MHPKQKRLMLQYKNDKQIYFDIDTTINTLHLITIEETLHITIFSVRVIVNFIRSTFKEIVSRDAMALFSAIDIPVAINTNHEIEISTYICTAQRVPK